MMCDWKLRFWQNFVIARYANRQRSHLSEMYGDSMLMIRQQLWSRDANASCIEQWKHAVEMNVFYNIRTNWQNRMILLLFYFTYSFSSLSLLYRLLEQKYKSNSKRDNDQKSLNSQSVDIILFSLHKLITNYMHNYIKKFYWYARKKIRNYDIFSLRFVTRWSY